MKIIEVDVTDAMRDAAIQRARDYQGPRSYGRPKYPHKFVGFLGEIGVEHVLTKRAIPFVYSNGNPQYDYLILGHTFEVKTQTCDSCPRADFEGNLRDRDYANQVADCYLFVRARGDSATVESYKRLYVIGFCSRHRMLERSSHHGQGEKNYKITFWRGCWSIPYTELSPIDQMRELLEARNESPRRIDTNRPRNSAALADRMVRPADQPLDLRAKRSARSSRARGFSQVEERAVPPTDEEG